MKLSENVSFNAIFPATLRGILPPLFGPKDSLDAHRKVNSWSFVIAGFCLFLYREQPTAVHSAKMESHLHSVSDFSSCLSVC